MNTQKEVEAKMSELKCTRYDMSDYDEAKFIPCQCPVCGGFLRWNGNVPICKKCGTELLMIPDHDEETGEQLEWGKICPISKPKKKERLKADE